jgi:hypothetical protein
VNHNLHQLHQVHWIEEVQPHEPAGAGKRPGDLGYREGRRVACQQGSRACAARGLLEDGLFDGEVLDHRFDHQVRTPRRFDDARGRMDSSLNRVRRRLLHLAAAHRPGQVARNAGLRRGQCLGPLVGKPHLPSRAGCGLGDAVAHCAGPDHRDAFNPAQGMSPVTTA